MGNEKLYTRQDIRELTGIPEDVLNYFVREGLLEAAEGGGGKGQHRRFRQMEVNLAALLYQIKANSGANIGVLRDIVRSVRNSVEFANALPFSPSQFWESAPTAAMEERDASAGKFPEVVKYIRDHDYWELRDHIAVSQRLNNDDIGAGPEFFFKSQDGRWLFEAEDLRAAAPGQFTFLAIDMGALLESVWSSSSGSKSDAQ